MQLNNIRVTVNGQTASYPVRSGTTAEALMENPDFSDIFELPENVSPLINGTAASGRVLQEGDNLSFQTQASTKNA